MANAIGQTDVFVTMTVNQNWSELKQRLPTGALVYDYPDIVNRVLKHKLGAFKARLFSGGAWGPHTSEVASDGTTQ